MCLTLPLHERPGSGPSGVCQPTPINLGVSLTTDERNRVAFSINHFYCTVFILCRLLELLGAQGVVLGEERLGFGFALVRACSGQPKTFY
jgi:hypothetical protein